jgi:hypothetical protein
LFFQVGHYFLLLWEAIAANSRLKVLCNAILIPCDQIPQVVFGFPRSLPRTFHAAPLAILVWMNVSPTMATTSRFDPAAAAPNS